MEQATEIFERERRRLTGIASRLLDDPHEAEDMVQQAWLRLAGTTLEVLNLPAWLTTVTTRLCLDRFKSRTAVPLDVGERVDSSIEPDAAHDDPSSTAVRHEVVGQALQIVLTRLTPDERVAFVLADTFGFDFGSIGEILGKTAPAARKLASRARSKMVGDSEGGPVPAWQVVDAFLAAARGGDLHRLLALLAPGVVVSADAAAVLVGTPSTISGRDDVARFFDGSARAARGVFIDGRPGAAWFHRGLPRVGFDFTVIDGSITDIVFRADPAVLSAVTERKGDVPHQPPPDVVSHS